MNRDIRHIVVLGAQPEWLSGLRGPMLRDFAARGYRVTAIGSEELPQVRSVLEGWGIAFEVVPLRRAGLNPFLDLRACLAIFSLLRRLRPDLLLAYTVKPIVYGLPIAWLAGVRRRYAMITGRGYAFLEGRELSRRISRRLATILYRFALKFADGVLFHNQDDRAMFIEQGIIREQTRVKRIWGSGIDLDRHRPKPLPPLSQDEPVRFLMIGRLVIDKGVNEYAEAARIIKSQGLPADFRLVGPTDPSPNAVQHEVIDQWEHSKILRYVGPVEDVRQEIADCHVFVLPSYAEGLPRSVLEGMAAGRPVITTHAPGCRDTVEEETSGYLVPVRNPTALAAAMKHFIKDRDKIAQFGQRSLQIARERFDVDSVNRDIADFLGI